MALIIPKVFSDAVNARLSTTLQIGKVAFDATPYVSEIGNKGDTVNFPRFKRTVSAVEVTKGTALTPAVIDMTDNPATIKQVAAPVTVYDVESQQIQAPVMDRMVEQVSDAMRLKIDSDLVTTMDNEAIYKIQTGAVDQIAQTELDNAFSSFGDAQNYDDFAGIIIHSKLLPSLKALNQFTSTTLTTSTANNGIVRNGIVGYYAGIPVIMCNNNTITTGATPETKTYIVKKNSLGYIFQKNINVEEQRELLLLRTNIVASSLYATKVVDEQGICILRKTIA
ncbi:hypothetical protein [Caproiciproducens sp.]